MADGPEGARKRNLEHLAMQDQHQALVVAVIVKHLGSETAYVAAGSAERDLEAAVRGEFAKNFNDGTELSADAYKNVAPVIDWDDLFNRELEAVHA